MTVQSNARMPVPHYHESWDEISCINRRDDLARGAQDVGTGPGESVFVKRGVVHSFRNDTQEAASCICILTPGVLAPIFVKWHPNGSRRSRPGQDEGDDDALRLLAVPAA